MEENIKKSQGKGLKKLNKKHLDAIELMVAGYFATDRDLAGYIGVSPETLSRWKNSDIFRDELLRRLDEEDKYRRMRYRAKANYAAEKLFEMMDSFTDKKMAMQAVLKVLELAGDTAGGKEASDESQGSFGVVVLPGVQIPGADNEQKI